MKINQNIIPKLYELPYPAATAKAVAPGCDNSYSLEIIFRSFSSLNKFQITISKLTHNTCRLLAELGRFLVNDMQTSIRSVDGD